MRCWAPFGGFDILDAVAQEATLALSAEGLGAMERLYKDTVEYTQNREQFGHPSPIFKRLPAWWKCSWSTSNASLCSTGRPWSLPRMAWPPTSRSPPVSTLWALPAASSARTTPWRHGGHGGAGHRPYFKRLFVIDTQFGNADYTSSVTQHELGKGEAPLLPLALSLANSLSPLRPWLKGALISFCRPAPNSCRKLLKPVL